MSNPTKHEQAPWWIRLWVRLTSHRATPAEIAAEPEPTQADIDRMLRRMHDRGHLTGFHSAACPICRAERKDQ